MDRKADFRVPKEFFIFIEDKISAFFEVSHLDIFALNTEETAYVLEKNVMRVQEASGVIGDKSLDFKSPIIKHLLETKKPILKREINEGIIGEKSEVRRKFLSSLIKQMDELRAEVCVPDFINDRLVIMFVLGKKLSGEGFSVQEIELFSSLVDQSAKVNFNFDLLKEDVERFVKSIRKVNDALEVKDPYTRGHSDRVAQFSVIVASKLRDELKKVPYGEISLYYAAELHDVGKIYIADSVIKKASSLTKEEYDEIKKHPVESMKIISPMKKWFGESILEAVLFHHENYDGTGYPYGKRGNEINILARIIRVADSFDAMVTDRPYRRAMVHRKALFELEKGQGTLYDSKVVDAFLKSYEEGLFKYIFLSQIKGQE
jgi:HD-GYP domain-containing protein (c-di-GMP phosphodiesterase class II)